MSEPSEVEVPPGDPTRLALPAGPLARWLAPTSQSRLERIPCSDVDTRPWPDPPGGDLLALTRSIRHRGIVEPLLLRPIESSRFQVVLGARRLEVARRLGLPEVPAIVRELDEAYPIDTTTGNPDCSGPGSFHTKATGWGVWGSALGTDFMAKDSAGLKGSYDASKYKGISFWAKSAAPLTKVQVSFPDIYTDGGASFAGTDAADAGISQCVYAPDESVKCSPYLVKFGDSAFSAYMDYQIDTTWKRFDIMFADTLQDQYNKGFHTAANKIDTAHLTAMAIQVNADFSTTPPTPNDYEIWVDDINFIK